MASEAEEGGEEQEEGLGGGGRGGGRKFIQCCRSERGGLRARLRYPSVEEGEEEEEEEGLFKVNAVN